ncbi:hypothetical protein BkAM31D_21735 [Halalkalibacter krulwichiae]|uniref:Uncharacterized protein n=1 Tax=Halalkalibacter krulwichiae TaxID=199441 RepID=A0A1X9MHU7_9BACI|nr:hypothetical protein BkAM31D_21735 [Halalkalibacter krulwichiae]
MSKRKRLKDKKRGSGERSVQEEASKGQEETKQQMKCHTEPAPLRRSRAFLFRDETTSYEYISSSLFLF